MEKMEKPFYAIYAMDFGHRITYANLNYTP